MEFWHDLSLFTKENIFFPLVIVDRFGSRTNHFQTIIMALDSDCPFYTCFCCEHPEKDTSPHAFPSIASPLKSMNYHQAVCLTEGQDKLCIRWLPLEIF